jgi:hypothetical protein
LSLSKFAAVRHESRVRSDSNFVFIRLNDNFGRTSSGVERELLKFDQTPKWLSYTAGYAIIARPRYWRIQVVYHRGARMNATPLAWALLFLKGVS